MVAAVVVAEGGEAGCLGGRALKVPDSADLADGRDDLD